MNCISIQIAPEFLPDFDRHEFLLRVRSVGRSPEIDTFNEKGKTYLQFNFFTERPTLLWQALQDALYKNSEYSSIISPISIAIFEDNNEKSTDSILVLHHFDANEKIDSLT